jgi:hypothetical protein
MRLKLQDDNVKKEVISLNDPRNYINMNDYSSKESFVFCLKEWYENHNWLLPSNENFETYWEENNTFKKPVENEKNISIKFDRVFSGPHLLIEYKDYRISIITNEIIVWKDKENVTEKFSDNNEYPSFEANDLLNIVEKIFQGL